jgi:glyoxylase-like metal-dependent hydrolase (beta-lactamase superfamily II)
LWDAADRVLWSGDHLLGRIVPIAALDADGTAAGRRPALLDYLGTLARYAGLAPDILLPGHGKPFTDVDVLVRRLRTHHAARADAVEAILRDLGTATPWEITTRLLWQPDGYRAVLGIAEAATHLDVLEAEGRVECNEEHGQQRYRVCS